MNVFNENNPYGYRLNINHPKVHELYRGYMRWKELPPHFPLSDAERLEFEEMVLAKLKGEFHA